MRGRDNYMGLNGKYTTAKYLQKAIDEKLITIESVQIESKDDYIKRSITPDQFKNDLDFYMESGIFADSIDFRYVIHDADMTVYAGNMSNYCNSCITVHLKVNDGTTKENIDKKMWRINYE